MAKYNHLTFEERIRIEQMLNAKQSFYAIAKALGRAHSTIVREFHRNCEQAEPQIWNCKHRHACPKGYKRRGRQSLDYRNPCHASASCKAFEEDGCPKLRSQLLCCNTCSLHKLHKACGYKKKVYKARYAQETYQRTLSVTRQGCYMSQEALLFVQGVLGNYLKGQSIYHIYHSNEDDIPCSRRHLYRLIHKGFLKVNLFDMRRKLRFKPKRRYGKRPRHKVDPHAAEGRSYADFQSFLQENPDLEVPQMDSVLGPAGSKKAFLVILFPLSKLTLLYLRDRNSSKSVIEIFNRLEKDLGPALFYKLFKAILTDNGSEFSNPKRLERSFEGIGDTKIFYCEPMRSYQKAHVENANIYIRYIVKKGKSFDWLTEEHVQLMQAHLNGHKREALSGRTPYEVFCFQKGQTVAKKLGLYEVPAHAINLHPSLIEGR